MAIKPKKQTSSNRGETGGGAPRGGARGLGSLKPAPKPAPKPKVSLKPEPSSMKLVPAKRSLFGPEEAAAGNKRILDARARTNPASAKVEKRALKAANKPIKSKSADSARAQAQAISNARAIKAMEDRLKAFKSLKPGQAPPKKLTTEQKFGYRRSMDYGPDGVMTKQAAKSIKQQKALDKLYKSGYLK